MEVAEAPAHRFAYWRWRRIAFEGNPEASGYVLIGLARGPIQGFIAVYIVFALTGLGESVQNCTTRRIEIGGVTVLTTSIVSLVLSLDGICNAIFVPLVGAWVDTTSHRTLLFQVSLVAEFVILAVAALVAFGKGQLWSLLTFIVLLLISSVVFEVMAFLHAAMVPEIATDSTRPIDGKPTRSQLVTRMYTWLNGNQLLYVLVAVGANLAFGTANDEVAAAQVAALIMLIFNAFWGTPALFMFEGRHKPANALNAGFLGIPGTVRTIWSCFKEFPQVGIFFLQYCCAIAGTQSIIGLIATYLLSETGIEPFKLQVVTLLVLVFTIPGSLAVDFLNKRLGDLRKVNLLVLLLGIVITVLSPVVLRGEVDLDPRDVETEFCAAEDPANITRKALPVTNVFVWLAAPVFGVFIGAVFATNIALFANLVPGGKEASMFSLRIFFGKLLSWSPPLIYTAVNESSENLRLALGVSIAPFLFVAFFFAYILDLEKARNDIEHTLHLRHGHSPAKTEELI